MEKWYAIVDDATGDAVSFGTVVANPMPAGYVAIAIAGCPQLGERWNKATRRIEAAPAAADPLKAAYATAVTVDAKLDLVAQRLGLK